MSEPDTSFSGHSHEGEARAARVVDERWRPSGPYVEPGGGHTGDADDRITGSTTGPDSSQVDVGPVVTSPAPLLTLASHASAFALPASKRVEIQARRRGRPGIENLGVYVNWTPPLPAVGDSVITNAGDGHEQVTAITYDYGPGMVVVTLWVD